jgi:glycosyltransferase involved in cell wall biosynthesis
MKTQERLRVAWLFPSMARGFYWHPVLSEFAKLYPQTIVFTGVWPGFIHGFESSFKVKVVGKTRFLVLQRTTRGSGIGITLPPLAIIYYLLRFRPHVIFTISFTLWSAISLLVKSWLGSRVIIVYDGSSPSVDMINSRFRLFIRSVIARRSDAFITNSQGGRRYLTKVLKAKESRVFAKPYEVPCVAAMSALDRSGDVELARIRHPVFIVVSRLAHAKGLHFLLRACSTLQRKGYSKYSLLIVGDGPQRGELQHLASKLGLEGHIIWTGWVDYVRLNEYFKVADVFIFPTLEDTWGMVVLEAMAFGKAILCSELAGAAEMVVDSENGYAFNPNQYGRLGELMQRFIDDSGLASSMGARSKRIIESHSPVTAAEFLGEIIQSFYTRRNRSCFGASVAE